MAWLILMNPELETFMPNSDTAAAMHFHGLTKYMRWEEDDGGFRSWMGEPPNEGPSMGEQSPVNEPMPYKLYTDLPPIQLPREFEPTSLPGLAAIAATGEDGPDTAVPGLADLARICLLSNGILKRGSHGTGRVIEYRAAGGTGARYHLELYIVCGDIPDLDAGIYHYSVSDHSFRQLRAGDYRKVLVDATGAEPAVASAPATIVCTSTFWRNAWRYLNRAYRHAHWDMGTTLVNVLAMAAAQDLPAKVVFGFVDDQVNALIDVDGEREAALSMVTIGRGGVPAQEAPAVVPLNHATQQISTSEIDFPDIWAFHRQSGLASGDEVAAWRASPLVRHMPEPTGKTFELRPVDIATFDAPPVEQLIQRRRSVRHYDVDTPVPFEAFSTLLDISSRGFASDSLDHTALPVNDRYLIVNNVEGLEPGKYVHHPARGVVELLEAGDFRAEAAFLASGQEYAANAHVNVYSLVDLDAVLKQYGNRGYRIAQTEGALLPSQLHLATHALGLGAVGSTSVDNAVIDFFSPHAAGKSYMFILTFGVRRRRARST